MNICGIDPSLTSTGIVVFDADGKMIFNKMIKTKKLREMPRLKFIKDEIVNILKTYEVTNVCIESYAYGVMKSRSKFNLGELGGVIRLMLYESSIDFTDIAPPTLKKYVTGMGNADKTMVIESVRVRWGIDFNKDSDLADAYGLAKMAYDKYVLKNDLVSLIEKIKKDKINLE